MNTAEKYMFLILVKEIECNMATQFGYFHLQTPLRFHDEY
jgi:hypothetical protein